MINISDVKVAQILSQRPDLIREAVLEALTEHSNGQIRQIKTSLRKNEDSPASDRLTSMMGFVGKPPRVIGFKLIGSSPTNSSIGLPRADVLIILCDQKTHALRYIIAGSDISLRRTAEIAVLGIQHLRTNAKKICIVGAGKLGQTIDSCIQTRMANVKEVITYGRESLKQLGKSGQIPNEVVIKATRTDKQLLSELNLRDVRLVVNLGLREFSSDTIATFDDYIVDDFKSCASQATPFADALRSKLILPENVRQLSAIMNAPLKINSTRRVYFQPSGMVAIDLLAAAKVLELSEQGAE